VQGVVFSTRASWDSIVGNNSLHADVVRRLDTTDAAALRRGYPTLGVDGGSEERAYEDDGRTA
jgi:hypothetical protein